MSLNSITIRIIINLVIIIKYYCNSTLFLSPITLVVLVLLLEYVSVIIFN